MQSTSGRRAATNNVLADDDKRSPKIFVKSERKTENLKRSLKPFLLESTDQQRE